MWRHATKIGAQPRIKGRTGKTEQGIEGS